VLKMPRLRVLRNLFAGFVLAVAAVLSAGTFATPEWFPQELRPHLERLFELRDRFVPGPPQVRRAPSYSSDSGEVQVWLTPDPTVADKLAAFIDGAETTVDFCVYDLDLPQVVQALLDAHARGVKVRVITETDNGDNEELSRLKAAGMPLRHDQESHYMHHKFVVVDGKAVWTGSMNFTENGVRYNDNSAAVIGSGALAENYTTEFAEMWAGHYGSDSPTNTPWPRIEVGTTVMENYFSPDDGVLAELLSEVALAENRIDVMAFSFTSDALADALAAAVKRGVQVRAVFEGRNAGSRYSDDERLRRAGADVRLAEDGRGVMHHKAMIIDDRTVVFGSYNFSKNAETRNDENVLIVHAPPVNAVYREAFDLIWARAH